LVQLVQCGHALVTRLRFADVRIGADWRLSCPRSHSLTNKLTLLLELRQDKCIPSHFLIVNANFQVGVQLKREHRCIWMPAPYQLFTI